MVSSALSRPIKEKTDHQVAVLYSSFTAGHLDRLHMGEVPLSRAPFRESGQSQPPPRKGRGDSERRFHVRSLSSKARRLAHRAPKGRHSLGYVIATGFVTSMTSRC